MSNSHPVQVRVEGFSSPLVTFTGELNYRSAPVLQETLLDLLDAGSSEILLDCETVEFVDSSGIGVIVGAASEMKAAGGRLCLLKKTHQLDHALQVSGFASLVHSEDEVVEHTHDFAETQAYTRSMTLSFPPGCNLDGNARRKVTDMARTMPFDERQIDDIALAVGEAISNAFRHGVFDHDVNAVCISCRRNSAGIVVEVRNPGTPFDPDSLATPDAASFPEGGMGVFFMRATMDSVDFHFGDGMVTVRMTKSFWRNEETPWPNRARQES